MSEYWNIDSDKTYKKRQNTKPEDMNVDPIIVHDALIKESDIKRSDGRKRDCVMRVYHGSYVEVAKPDILHSREKVDFGLPLNLHLPKAVPTAIGDMSHAELDAELAKGMESLKSGKVYTANEVDAELAKEFDI